jgi:hypothetical protein
MEGGEKMTDLDNMTGFSPDTNKCINDMVRTAKTAGFTERTVFFSKGGDNYCLPESKARRMFGDIKTDLLIKHQKEAAWQSY